MLKKIIVSESAPLQLDGEEKHPIQLESCTEATARGCGHVRSTNMRTAKQNT